MRTGVAAAILLSFALHSIAAPADRGDSLIVLVSGGTRGRVNGCNCSSGPQGGIERRASLVADIIGAQVPFGFDCGGMLDLDPEGGMARSRCMIQGLARQGVRVAGVAGRDLFYGTKFLADASAASGVTLVSGNLKDAGGGSPFPEWTTVSFDGVTFAATSLCEPLPRLSVPGSLAAVEPDSVLARLVATAPDAAVHVLLTDLPEASLRRLLNSTSLFDIALTCSRQVYSAMPLAIGKCLVYHPEPDGRSAEALIIPRSGSASGSRVVRKPIERLTPADPATVEWLNECLKGKSAQRPMSKF